MPGVCGPEEAESRVVDLVMWIVVVVFEEGLDMVVAIVFWWDSSLGWDGMRCDDGLGTSKLYLIDMGAGEWGTWREMLCWGNRNGILPTLCEWVGEVVMTASVSR